VRGKRKDDLLAIQLFENKTGKSVYTMEEVSKWVQENRIMPMPEPPTAQQMLVARLSHSAGAARRRDPDSPVPYRAHHTFRVEKNGQWSYHWFDADGPGATAERLDAATRPRRELALNIGVQVNADYGHHRRTHPDEQVAMPDFDLNWEISLRLGGQDAEGENRKAG